MIQTLHNGVLEVQIICIRMTGQVLLTTTDVALLMMLVSVYFLFFYYVWKSAKKWVCSVNHIYSFIHTHPHKSLSITIPAHPRY